MADSGARINGGMSAGDMAKYFPVSAGDKDDFGVLKLPDAESANQKKEQPKQPEKQPSSDAQLAAEEERSQGDKNALKIRELSLALNDALNTVHSAQVAKIGGVNNHSDLMVRNLVRDVTIKLGQEQRKQNTAELQGQVAKLGEELKKLGPTMEGFWQNQVSMNRLDLPN